MNILSRRLFASTVALHQPLSAGASPLPILLLAAACLAPTVWSWTRLGGRAIEACVGRGLCAANGNRLRVGDRVGAIGLTTRSSADNGERPCSRVTPRSRVPITISSSGGLRVVDADAASTHGQAVGCEPGRCSICLSGQPEPLCCSCAHATSATARRFSYIIALWLAAGSYSYLNVAYASIAMRWCGSSPGGAAPPSACQRALRSSGICGAPIVRRGLLAGGGELVVPDFLLACTRGAPDGCGEAWLLSIDYPPGTPPQSHHVRLMLVGVAIGVRPALTLWLIPSVLGLRAQLASSRRRRCRSRLCRSSIFTPSISIAWDSGVSRQSPEPAASPCCMPWRRGGLLIGSRGCA
jgi:hypothetical protein